MKPQDHLALLREFYADKSAAYRRHLAGARLIGQYDANNTYQYIINREETQLAWLERAIADLGGVVPGAAPEPTPEAGVDAAKVFKGDALDAQAFVDRWRPRVEAMDNARDRLMLRVILGETLEQRRFFDQALAGRTDLLGRREEEIVGPAQGTVLPTRWVE